MKCQECGAEALISKILPYCPNCIRKKFDKLSPKIQKIHADTRKKYGLPQKIPANDSGKVCTLCVNRCCIGNGEKGYCGIRQNVDNKIVGPDKNWAYVDWYHDPLPTNCVADWICEGSKDYGYKNLAVFYEGCTFNCLFCQNWHFRDRKRKADTCDLVRAADPLTGCICYFGGDPTPFALHSLEVSRQILEKRKKFRICWETNGSVAPKIMKKWIEYALKSNGCIKIDFKTFSEELNIALCGSSNKNTKENIKQVAEYMSKREKPPILILSTLLIPGYVDKHEIEQMAKFISLINKKIPWSFLGFYPHFYFNDMPCTSRSQAEEALNIAKNYGIENTHIGNVHLLT
jgi:pyruvate formate lyase activating enzyme